MYKMIIIQVVSVFPPCQDDFLAEEEEGCLDLVQHDAESSRGGGGMRRPLRSAPPGAVCGDAIIARVLLPLALEPLLEPGLDLLRAPPGPAEAGGAAELLPDRGDPARSGFEVGPALVEPGMTLRPPVARAPLAPLPLAAGDAAAFNGASLAAGGARGSTRGAAASGTGGGVTSGGVAKVAMRICFLELADRWKDRCSTLAAACFSAP